MKKLFTFLLLLSCMSVFAQKDKALKISSDLDAVSEKIEQMSEDLEAPEYKFDLKKVRTSLNDINTDFNDFTANQVIEDYLAFRIYSMQTDIEVLYIQSQLQSGKKADLGRLTSLREKKLRFLYTRNKNLREVYENIKSFKKSEHTLLEKISGGLYETNMSYEDFKERSFAESVEMDINRLETTAFEATIRDTTRAELETYLHFGVMDSENSADRGVETYGNFSKAFRMYYELMTVSGDNKLRDAADEYIKDQNLDSWSDELEEIKASHSDREDKQIANRAAQIFGEANLRVEELPGFIKDAAEFEVGYLALQALLKPSIENGDFMTAIKEGESYRIYFASATRTASSQIYKKYKMLMNLLGQMQKFKLGQVQKLDAYTGSSPDRIVRQDRDGNYLGVFSGSEGQIFNFDGANWKLLREKTFADDVVPHFSPKSGRDYDVIDYPSRRDILGKASKDFLGDKLIGTDFYVDFKLGVLLFSSNSAVGRGGKTKKGIEYTSPGLIPSGVSLKSEEFENTTFHGAQYGATNLDIYVSFLSKTGMSWNPPVNIGKINTPYAERTPMINEAGNLLYFSSEGYPGLGGYDLFQVPISKKGNKLEIVGKVKSLCGLNTVGNDIAATPLTRLLGGESQCLFISDFGSDMYQLYKYEGLPETCELDETKPELQIEKTKRVKINLKNPNSPLVQFSNGDIQLDLECFSHPPVQDLAIEDGEISIQGRVYDSLGRPVKEGDISFLTKNGGPHEYEKVPLKVNDNGFYHTILQDSATYRVIISVTTIDGEYYKEMTKAFIELCPNIDGEQVAYKDFQTKSMDEYVANEIDLGLPFFFNFDEYHESICRLNIMEEEYKTHLGRMMENPDIGIRLVGYADNRGEKEYNLQLGRDRCQTVSALLAQWNFDLKRIKSSSKGKTIFFNNEKILAYSKILPARVFTTDDEEKKYQLNRRVSVEFVFIK